jgi:adenylyl cyclase-associated protein
MESLPPEINPHTDIDDTSEVMFGKAAPPPPPKNIPSTPSKVVCNETGSEPAPLAMSEIFKQIENRDFALKHVSDEGASERKKPKVKSPELKPREVTSETQKQVNPYSLKCERDTWYVENCSQTVSLNESDLSMKQSVYVGKASTGGRITVPGKVKSIVIDGCSNILVTCSSVISSVEIINCSRVQIIFQGKVPLLSVDKSEKITVYLNMESKNVQVATNKSCEILLNYPIGKTDEDMEFKEIAVPEQFMHEIINGKIISRVSDLYG